MPSAEQKLDLFILTRFSVLSEQRRHSWGIFGKRSRWLSKILPPVPPPDLAKKRAYLFDETRLRYRFWTFETFLLPSLANQDDNRFRHIVFVAEALPDWGKARLAELQTRFNFETVYVDIHVKYDDALQRHVPECQSGTTHSATMRIDDDDALGRTIVAELHGLAYEQEDQVATWPKGIYLTDRGKGNYTIRRIDRAFRACGLTRIRCSTRPTPTIHSAGNHKKIARNLPVLTLPGEDKFLMTVHPDNVSGRKVQRGDAKLTDADKADLLREFGIDLSKQVKD